MSYIPKLGDKVRYVGTKADDIYHGLLVGKVGKIVELYPNVRMGRQGYVIGSISNHWPLRLERV